MGLRAAFTMEDLNLPSETDVLGLIIDYTEGNEIFVETFLDVAKSEVPVDTGNLLGSIEANCDDFSVECVADCEYAEYVEYGTTYMGAQPYFEPAIEEAYMAAEPFWKNAIDEAQDEEEAELAARAASGQGGGGNVYTQLISYGFATHGILGGLMMGMAVIFMIAAVEFVKQFDYGNTNRYLRESQYSNYSKKIYSPVNGIEIEIF